MNDRVAAFTLSDIIIMNEFRATPPTVKKMIEKEQYLMATASLPERIILNDAGVLIDGYITYLLAMKHGYITVPVERGHIEVISARFKPSGKLYMWKVPRTLQGRVRVGDLVKVQVNCFRKKVLVERVDRMQYQEHALKNILQITCR